MRKVCKVGIDCINRAAKKRFRLELTRNVEEVQRHLVSDYSVRGLFQKQLDILLSFSQITSANSSVVGNSGDFLPNGCPRRAEESEPISL